MKKVTKDLQRWRLYAKFAFKRGGNKMNYTKETLRITNPSSQLLDLIKKIRKNKRSEIEKLHDMKPEDFDIRVSL